MNYAELRVQAELALAAYANLLPGEPLSLVELGESDFVNSQAVLFSQRFSVKATFSDGTGASATVFEENGTGRTFLAVRGTEFTNPNDLFADGILATAGVSFLNLPSW